MSNEFESKINLMQDALIEIADYLGESKFKSISPSMVALAQGISYDKHAQIFAAFMKLSDNYVETSDLPIYHDTVLAIIGKNDESNIESKTLTLKYIAAFATFGIPALAQLAEDIQDEMTISIGNVKW